ncbi:MAG: hypothetical protein QW405_02345 [Fervidicoccaceae archaeon]
MSRRRSYSREIDEILSQLPEDERRALEYFLVNVSVGELCALRELQYVEGVPDPSRVLSSLVRRGLLERAGGCYNLSPKLRELLRRRS